MGASPLLSEGEKKYWWYWVKRVAELWSKYSERPSVAYQEGESIECKNE